MVGKKNMAFGFFYFVLTLGLGMFLASKLGSGDQAWMESQGRAVLRAAHAHGNLEALLNIVVGYIISRLAFDAWLAKTVSVLLIVGAVFHSGMLYTGGLGMHLAFNLTPVGGISLIAAMLLMGAGVLRLKNAG